MRETTSQQKKGSKEPEYLREAREVLRGMLLDERSGKTSLKKSDILTLISAKHRAYREGNMGFEGILLDAGKLCDEMARESSDSGVYDKFTVIATYFDRYDHIQTLVGRIVFEDSEELTVDSLISLFGNKKVFDRLYEGLFYTLFIRNNLENKHLTPQGRKKLKTIAFGLERITQNKAFFEDVVSEFKNIASEEG